jgi:anti-sigma B factor antagonist
MIRLKCFSCGLTVAYRGSERDLCPRCSYRDHQSVRLIAVSDEVAPLSNRAMGHLSINTRVRDGRYTIALRGELDIGSAQILDAAIAEACEAQASEVIVDLGGIEFMDSTGLNSILRGQSRCEELKCAFSLTPAQQPVQQVFEVTSLAKRLPFRKGASLRKGP